MSSALALQSRDVLVELRQLLLELDPATWRTEVMSEARARALRIQQELQVLIARFDGHPASHLREQLEGLADRFEAHRPTRDLPADSLHERWTAFRAELQPAYESVVAGLRDYAVHVPSLRPTNYARNVYHVANAVLALAIIVWIPRIEWLVMAAGSIAGFAWSCEALRRISPRINEFLMRIFSRVSHPHERYRVNSATWYSTALLALSLTSEPRVMALAVMILGVGDPVAALVGRRWGRRRLTNGRTVEGSLAFVASAWLLGFVTLTVLFPETRYLVAAIAAFVGAFAGAWAEVLSRRIDDNLSIPVVAGGAGWLALALML